MKWTRRGDTSQLKMADSGYSKALVIHYIIELKFCEKFTQTPQLSTKFELFLQVDAAKVLEYGTQVQT